MPKFQAARDDGKVRSEKITVRFTPEAMKILRRMAVANDMNVSDAVRKIISEWFESKK